MGQNVIIIIDFTTQCNFQYQIPNDKEYVYKRIREIRTCFQKQNEIYRYERHKIIDYCPRIEWIGIIGELKRNGELIVNSIIKDVSQVRGNQPPPPFNQVITQMIEESRAIAASNTLVKDREMGGAWIVEGKLKQIGRSNNTP